jgi:hypothetical protein
MAFTESEWNEDVFKGAVAGCSAFVGLFNVIAAEEGGEKASEMLKKLGSAMGSHSGEMLKESLGGQGLDAQKLSELIAGFDASFGARTEVEQEGDAFKLRVHDCPLAAAYAMMGVDHETGKRICEDWGVTLFGNLMSVLAPNGKYELCQFRESWDGYCEESYSVG